MNLVVEFNRGNVDKVIDDDLDSYFSNMDVLITIRTENHQLWIGSNFHEIFIRDLFYRLDILYKESKPFYIDTWGNGDFYYFRIHGHSITIEKNNKESITCNAGDFRVKLSESMENFFSKLRTLNPSVVKHGGYINLRNNTMSGQ